MMGIRTEDFDLLLKKNDAILEDVISDLSKVRNSCLSLNSNITLNNVKVLNSKFDSIISQLNNVSNKLNGYQNTLRSVYNSYQEQLGQVIIDSKKLIS